MKSIYVNPQTGGYERVDNRLEYVQSGVNACNMLLMQPVGSYLYDKEIGNPLLSYQRLPTRQEVVNGIAYCLTPLLNTSQIISATVVSYQVTALGKAKIVIDIVLPNGDKTPLIWKQ